jgi:pyruvate dehydrogenase E2 component (dihydrolipoamide acetyltransferase)
MTEITMPQLSDSMEEGIILSWLKRDGDRVESGEELVEIETDKATMTYESPAAGIVQILAPEGVAVAVGQPIALVGGPTEAVATQPAAPAPMPAETPVSTPSESASSSPRSDPRGVGTNGTGDTAVAVRATPLARRVAADHGVDLGAVAGSGPHGRVTRADVVAAASLSSPSPVPAGARPSRPVPEVPSPPAAPPVSTDSGVMTSAKGVSTVQKLTRVQQVIARRMAETKATVPDFQVQTEAEMDALLALRAQLKAAADRPPSVNDFIVKAAALALRDFPLANGSYTNGSVELHSRVNVGVAVAADGALIVPTVTDADTRSLGAIASEVRRLAAAVRDGTVAPSELSGATFTVSNLGMYGMTAITPVINAPQAAILGVGVARPVLHRVDGEIVERQLMTLTLSCDHSSMVPTPRSSCSGFVSSSNSRSRWRSDADAGCRGVWRRFGGCTSRRSCSLALGKYRGDRGGRHVGR